MKQTIVKPETIATNLKRLRTYRSYSQKRVAGAIHISRQAYSNYERGTRIPDLQTAARLAAFYRTTLEYLVWAEDPVTYQNQQAPKSYGVLTEVGNIIPLEGPGIKLIQRYEGLSESGKRELEAFAEFKELYEKRRG